MRELTQQIRDTIEQFQRRYSMTPAEVRQALWHASLGWRAPGLRNRVTRTVLFWLVVIALPLIVSAIMRASR